MMRNSFGYFFLANMVALVVFGIRAAYFAQEMVSYLQTHYPERAKEFEWYGYRLIKALYRKHDIEDAEFARLQTKARYAQMWVILALLPFPLFLVMIFIMSIILG
jgi:hypothetical protein